MSDTKREDLIEALDEVLGSPTSHTGEATRPTPAPEMTALEAALNVAHEVFFARGAPPQTEALTVAVTAAAAVLAERFRAEAEERDKQAWTRSHGAAEGLRDAADMALGKG